MPASCSSSSPRPRLPGRWSAPSSSATSPRWELHAPRGLGELPLAWWGRGDGGLPALCVKRWLLGRAGRQGGTVGISISSRSSRRVSIATGLARKCDCGAAEDAFYSSAGFVWGGQDGTGAQHPSPGQAAGSGIRALLSSPGSQHGWGLSTPTDAARGMYGCGEGRRLRKGSLGTAGSSCAQNQSHRSPSPALTVMRVFRSLAPCWQQPMVVHQLHFPGRGGASTSQAGFLQAELSGGS